MISLTMVFAGHDNSQLHFLGSRWSYVHVVCRQMYARQANLGKSGADKTHTMPISTER